MMYKLQSARHFDIEWETVTNNRNTWHLSLLWHTLLYQEVALFLQNMYEMKKQSVSRALPTEDYSFEHTTYRSNV